MLSKVRINQLLCVTLFLASSTSGCVKPPGGSAMDKDMGPPVMADMEVIPDMAVEEPVDMEGDLSPSDGVDDMPLDDGMDQPDDMLVCEPNVARCASESVREVCDPDGKGKRAEPCDASEVCVGGGVCTPRCGEEAGEVCGVERLAGLASGPHVNRCLGTSILSLDQYILAGDPCADLTSPAAGLVQAMQFDDGALVPKVVLDGGGAAGRFGTSMAILNGDLFVGEPDGNTTGSIHYFSEIEEIISNGNGSGRVLSDCALTPESGLESQAWGEVLAVLPEHRLLFVSDPEWNSNSAVSIGRVYVYEVAGRVDCGMLGNALELRATLIPPNSETVDGFGAAMDVRVRTLDGIETVEVLIGAPGEDGALFAASVAVQALLTGNSSAVLLAGLVAHGDEYQVSELGNAVTFATEEVWAYASATGAEDNDAFYVVDFEGDSPALSPLGVSSLALSDSSVGLTLHAPVGGGGFWTSAISSDENHLAHVAVDSAKQSEVTWVIALSDLLQDGAMMPLSRFGEALISFQGGRYLIVGAPGWSDDGSDTRGALFTIDLGGE